MKQVFLCLLSVWALVAVCCAVETMSNEQGAISNGRGETENFVVQEDGDGDGDGDGGATEIELPVEVPPIVIPPIVVQPVVVVPIVPPTVIVKPIIVKPVIVPPEIGIPIVIPPFVIPPLAVPPHEGEGGDGEKPVVVPPEADLLMLNELRTEVSISGKRAEYIEFKARAAGNLKGLSLHIMNNAAKPFVYNFPAVTVASGEYITLHLQILESGCVDELGDDLSLSGGSEACPTARDLWVAGTAEVLNKTDIVYLQDANGKIIDAIVMNEKPGVTWNSKQAHFSEITDTLYNCGMWKSADGQKPTPFDTVNTSAIIGTSYSQSVSRDEDMENTHSADDWYITGIGGLTPGKPNQ